MRAAISACAAALEESVAINKTTLLFHDSVLSLETIGALGASQSGGVAKPIRRRAMPPVSFGRPSRGRSTHHLENRFHDPLSVAYESTGLRLCPISVMPNLDDVNYERPCGTIIISRSRCCSKLVLEVGAVNRFTYILFRGVLFSFVSSA